jgi:hypothetical protein
MPRLGGRKRREQMGRPPRPDRLADLILAGDFAELARYSYGPARRSSDRLARESIVAAVAARSIDITSAHDHALALQTADPTSTGWAEMVVGAVPPAPLMFAEARVAPGLSSQVARVGWALSTHNRGEEPQIAYDAMMASPQLRFYERCSQVVVGMLALGMRMDPSRAEMTALGPVASGVLFLDGAGHALAPPTLALPAEWTDPADVSWLKMWGAGSLFDTFLAFTMLGRGAASIVPCDGYESVVIPPPTRATA